MKQASLWFSDYNKLYTGTEPFFYNVNEIEVARALEQDYPLLLQELKVLWDTSANNSKGPAFGDYDSFDDKQFPPRSWQKMVLKVWGLKNNRVIKMLPHTARLINSFPDISSCFITKTAPNSIIRPHCGETNAHLRIHLGLNAPVVDKHVCGMEVGNETVGWQNGKTFAFLDAHNHHVWNKSDAERYVLIIDLIRPEFAHRKYFIYARVIVSQLYFYTASLIGTSFLFKISAKALDVLTVLLYLPIRLAVITNNRFNLIKL
jgi:hypothetical protein